MLNAIFKKKEIQFYPGWLEIELPKKKKKRKEKKIKSLSKSGFRTLSEWWYE